MSKQTELVGLARTTNLDEVNAAYSAGALSNRNVILNGAMNVAQRGTSFTNVSDRQYCLDRWNQEHADATFHLDIEQASGPTGEGFPFSLKATVQTTATLSTAGYIIPFEQRIEKSNTDQFCWGTPNAKPITISFWVKSNRTGTCTLDLVLGMATGGTDATATKQYTIDTAGAWEYKTLTFPANTTTYSGQASIHNGLTLFWWMIAGSNYTSGTAPSGWQPQVEANRAVGCSNSTTVGDYWQITGVQLEVGDTATPFEHRSYGQELALCHRYYYKFGNGTYFKGNYVLSGGNGLREFTFTHPTTMRSTPTIINSGTSWSGGYGINNQSATIHSISFNVLKAGTGYTEAGILLTGNLQLEAEL